MNAPVALRMTAVEWVLLFILGGLWGGTFFFNAIAIPELPPLVVILYRVALATVILWFFVLAGGIKVPRDRSSWMALLIMAALNSALPFFLIAWGQVHIPSGLASIMIATTPLFAVVAAHFWTSDERMTPGKVLGVLAGLVGVVVLIGPQFLDEIGKDLLGQLSVLGAAICYAVSAIYGRTFAKREMPPMMVATGQMTMATFILLPITLLVDQPWDFVDASLEAWGAVVGLAALSTSVAYLIFFRILARAGAVNILLVNFIVPVSAILLGVFILGEVLTLEQIVGMAFIALGLALIDGRLFARRKAKVD